MRNEAGLLEESVTETISVGRRADCATHISHHKAIGAANWGTVTRTLEMVDAANRSGGDVSLDAYPYTAGSSTLLSLIPSEYQGGGVDAIQARLATDAGRRLLVEAIAQERVFALSDVVLALVPSRPRLTGLRLVEAAEGLGMAPAELVAELIATDGVDVVMVAFGIDEADVARVLSHPRSMVASDGWVLATDASPCPHPRNFSTTARFLTAFVRDQQVVGLGEAIRKLTSLPADRLGMNDRGRLAPGAVADIAVLDYEHLEDLATYEDPCQYPVGIQHVLIDGTTVLEDGAITEARPGRLLTLAEDAKQTGPQPI
jgi:N-acyl-D-amino-acid deacylase